MKKKSRERKVKFTEVSKEYKYGFFGGLLLSIIGIIFVVINLSISSLSIFGIGIFLIGYYCDRCDNDEIVYKVKV